MATNKFIEFYFDSVEGWEIGQSICFEMYEDHLYTVSTLTTSDDDEPCSFYHWFCYSPRQKGQIWSGRIWRRDHREGPINEMWTQLSIQFDETAGRPVITECRREWADGNSENHRTNYFENLYTPTELRLKYPEGGIKSPPWSDNFNGAASGPDTAHLDSGKPKKRLRRNYHPEYENHDQTQRQEFIAAYTKYHCYHLSSSTFLDLVNDPVSQADGVHIRDFLRLRTISRRRKCPFDDDGIAGESGLRFQPTQSGANGRRLEGSDERFASRGMHMWPPEDAPVELRRLLCPSSCSGNMQAILDDRTLVYSVTSPGLPPGHLAIILISFDPMLHIPTLKPLGISRIPAHEASPFPVALTKPTESIGCIVKEVFPLYGVIDRGYRLR